MLYKLCLKKPKQSQEMTMLLRLVVCLCYVGLCLGQSISGIKLEGGSGPYEGRVELNINGVWGTICHNNFDMNDAKVLCRMMNLSATAYFPGAYYGQGIGPIFADNLGCSGHETHLEKCSFNPNVACQHSQDVSLICTKCSEFEHDFAKPSSVSSDGNMLYVTCDIPHEDEPLSFRCESNGTWSAAGNQCLTFGVEDIRLANKRGLYDGRVEIMMNGIWGTVCGLSFSSAAATVICNMFGLGYQTHYTGYYGGGSGPVHIAQLKCFGNESHLDNCTYSRRTTCLHSYDIAVVCKNSSMHFTGIRLTDGSSSNRGRVQMEASGIWGTICYYNMDQKAGLETICRMLGLNFTLAYSVSAQSSVPALFYGLNCNNWEENINTCSYTVAHRMYCSSSSTDLGLLCTGCGVPVVSNGFVLANSIYHNSTTTTIQCNSGYIPDRMTATCLDNGTWVSDTTCTRPKCGTPSTANGVIQSNDYVNATAKCNAGYKPALTVLRCLENGTWQADAPCTKIDFPLNITHVRLTYGTYYGRFEILVDGVWGTICSDAGFGVDEAEVLCRMLGLNYKDYRRDSQAWISNMVISNLNCYGNESHINDCSYNIQHNCGYNSYTYVPWIYCAAEQHNITNVRLAGANGPYNGRVEIEVNNTWGTICDNGFDSTSGATVCSMLDLKYHSALYDANYGQGTGPVYIEYLVCTGDQRPAKKHINECSYMANSTCSHRDDISVICYGPPLNITDIRLVNGTGPFDGRAEIKIDDVWGTICGRNFHSTYDADTICRTLGLRVARSSVGLTQGTGPIHIDELVCSSSYPHLNQCQYLFLNTCTHALDVSVVCYGSPLNITSVRLANGTGPYDGRAEMQVNGVWGTICDREFDFNDANLFCKILGLKAAHYLTGAINGEGTGPIHVDEFHCTSSTANLSQCQYLFLNSCTHARDVSVVCNECGRPVNYYWDVNYFSYNGTTLYADCAYYKTYVGTLQMTCDNITKTWKTEGVCQEYKFPLDVMEIRLVGGNSKSYGRVELKSLDRWGTVCDHSFGMNEANAICAMLGYWPATAFYKGAHFGEGSGPIFVDDLKCATDAKHINNCTYVTYDNCQHSNDVSVECNDCGDPTPHNGSARYNGTYYGAVAELSCNEGYRLIGHSIIKCELNHTWSNKSYCKLIDCEDPTPEHGSANSSMTTNGSAVAISCNEGYNLSGNGIITCMENDIWSDTPTCRIIDCGYPEPANAEVQLSTNETTYKAQAVVNCVTGYDPDGSWTLSCQANGSWEAWPECTIKDCGDPTPFKGSVNDTATVYGTVIKVTCDDGYNITGESVIICQQDGTWSNTPRCSSSDCGRPSVPNGVAELDNGTTSVGSVAYISCNLGYDLIGPSSIICTLDGWNDTVACVKQDCGDPTPLNGHAAFDGTKFGDRATITCNTGYVLDGDTVITCQAGGIWSDRPTCTLVDCGNPQTPANGIIDTSNGTVYNSTVTFGCNKGYLLVGASTTVCLRDGKWSEQSPTCAKKGTIGESCISVEYCKTEEAVCINNVCRCTTGIHDHTADKCNIMPMFSYGISAKDIQYTGEDLCSDKITFSPGIPVNGKHHKDLYVCVNGLISFDDKYTNPVPPKDRYTVSTDLGERIILAPFYAQINTSSGSLFYRTYDILHSFPNMQTDKNTIDYIVRLAKQFGNVDNFEASFVLIATWEKLTTSQPDYDNSRHSTFQLVLTSDGKVTMVMYIYGHEQMLWQKTVHSPTHVFVGHSTGKQFVHPFSYSQVVLSMDKAKTTDPLSREDVSGLVFQTISKVEEAKPNYAVDCINWYNRNWPEKFSNDIVNSRMPKCPCDIWLSRFDPWFWQVDRSALYSYTCVDMVPGIIYKPYGKSCCYKNTIWVDQRPHAGGFYRYHPLNDIKNHHLHDIDPKRTCCELSNYCKLYYDLRPTGACYGTSPYNFGMFWGDPHFRTLDGLNFTFNGLGEYTLLRIKNANVSFELQTRTARAVKADGSLSDATIFSAFAAMDHSNASFHAELNRAKTGLNVYVNGRDITTQYYAHNLETAYTYKPEENNIDISKRGDALHVFFQATGVALNVSVSSQMLSLSTIVPDTYRNTTKGLLGNYNNKPSDDFTLPNGTILSANMTEREIFSYGQLWSINPNMSAFIYEDGKSHEDFHNESYVPRFLDEVDPEKRKEAERVCNGSQNIECVFDYVFTEKIEVAEDANRIRQQAESTQEELDVTIPELQGCATVNATNSSIVTCKISVDGDYDVRFMENTIGAVYNSSTKVISFMQETADPVFISVAAVNHQGRSSLPFVVSVLLCTGCSGNGICTNTIRDDPRETEYYKYLTCQCNPQYEGLDCEHVFNGCRANPCSLGRNCTSLSANEQLHQNRTYKCGPCPVGYQSKDDYNVTCHDVDECSAQTVNCDHNCSNTVGSYQCTCLSGYRADSRNPHKCRDINECDEGVHTCTQLCANYDGGYNCSCHYGYSFNETSWSCHLNQDSSCSDNRTCLNTDGCIRQNNSDVCICNSGSELLDALNNSTCKDINECERNVCPQLCNNINGGFICSCFDGYRLEDKTACTECTVPYWGFNCSKRCDCSGQGALRCDPVKGCVCSEGWSGENCNNDIDECVRDPNICKDPRKECINIKGSFTCRCRKGYYENNSICEDLNECSYPLLNDCEQQCTNVIGGYSCSCLNGFKRYNNTSCEDIDECELGTAGCAQVCKNNPGLYSCFCHFGYTLNDDRKTCTKLSDPCKTINKLECSHFCYVSGNQASCRCQKGYQLATDNQTCIDVNECQDATLNLCDKKATCINIAGSFQCKCPSGTRLENDGRTCSDCDAFHYGENCAQNCSCLNGRCDKTTGCVCDQGWNGNRCDIDIDECKSGQLNCTKINSECKNTPGSAVCSCLKGYRNVTGYCEDIDECSKVDWNICDQQCVNLPGSYKCVCQPGFLFAADKCSDIDECSLKVDGCEQVCDNTIGSYRCSCEAGFTLNITDRKSCIILAENECSLEDKASCEPNATCFMNKGSATCRCKKGFANDSDKCIDIDECLPNQTYCAQQCNNTIGSFICGCNSGYVLQGDNFSCRECDKWNYGMSCAENCTCNTTNTENCSHTTGHCQCKVGWSGTNCSKDIDECKTDTAKCPQHSICRNTDGGYECDCDRGYIKTGSGECLACSNHKYGDHCQKDCLCDRENSETCHHVTGDCTCIKGWRGDYCTMDVDECTNTSICQTKQNSTCINAIGSYTCSCNHGFNEEANTCKDMDECLTAGHDCIQQCVNTVGGYNCKCRPGFHGSYNDCTACSSNQYGENCTGRCSCIIANSANKTQTCNRETGKCECSPNWTGDTCSQDVDECINQNNCPDNENKGCKNTDGWYKCECYRGFIELDNGTCAIDKESSAILDLKLKIKGVDLSEQQIKDDYDKLKQELEQSLKRLYRNYSKDPLHIRINVIKKGSLIVSYSVVYDKADTSLASAIAKALIDQGKGISSLSFNGTTFSITAEDYKDLEPCEIYQQTFGVCKKDLECLVENETPVCRPKSNDSSLPLIIGLSVGGFVLLVIITVITCCLWKRSHQDSHRGQFNNESSEYADIGKGQSNYSDYSSIGQWLRRMGTSEDGKYLTWKSMLSRSSRSENVYDSSFQIPRARTGMSPFAAGGSTSSVQDGM